MRGKIPVPNRRELLLSSAALLLTNKVANARMFHGSVAAAQPSLQFKTLKVGGGGFTRSMDIAPDGTKVCKVDVYGAYVWNTGVPSTGNAGGTGVWQNL